MKRVFAIFQDSVSLFTKPQICISCCEQLSADGSYCIHAGSAGGQKRHQIVLNMAPEAKIAARRLGLRLFLHKIRALNAFWDTYEVSKRGSVDSLTRELSFDTKLEYFWPAIGKIQRKRSELSVGYRFCARKY